MSDWQVIQGDCLQVLKDFAPGSFDAVITDPPAGIAFMGKAWDSDKGGRDSWIDWMAGVAAQCLRVLKPGAHALVWSLPRTSHWTATAMENAGFEVRDRISHIQGQGFPKSLDISKAIDKAAGIERNPAEHKWVDRVGYRFETQGTPDLPPATEPARLWQGWGTALKPAVEDWWLLRKPLDGTVAANVLKHGTGGLNVDGCRIATEDGNPNARRNKDGTPGTLKAEGWGFGNPGREWNGGQGRFPAHLILDEEAARMLDEQSGESRSTGGSGSSWGKADGVNAGWRRPAHANYKPASPGTYAVDSGGASRFYLNIGRTCILCESSSTKAGSKEVCNYTSADNAGRDLRTIRATIQSIAAEPVLTLPAERLAQRVPYVESLCDSCATAIAVALAGTRLLGFSPARSLHILASTGASNCSILLPSLVSFAGLWANTDTIPTTESLSLLCGSVLHAITDSTRETARSGQSRFAYSAKASRAEREEGLEGIEAKTFQSGCGGDMPTDDDGKDRDRFKVTARNHHPTVKPLALMRWLVRLITPPGGEVLDPFTGSGSTGVACAAEGVSFTGIELNADYAEIARQRIEAATRQTRLFDPAAAPVSCLPTEAESAAGSAESGRGGYNVRAT
jgi:site-specific DNA-methyltransferase (adenine-specific)